MVSNKTMMKRTNPQQHIYKALKCLCIPFVVYFLSRESRLNTLSKHVSKAQSTTNNGKCTLHVSARCAGGTRLQTGRAGVGRAGAVGRSSCGLCTTDNSKRSDSAGSTIGQGRGHEHKGADLAATGSVGGDEGRSSSISSSNHSSASGARKDNAVAILISGSHHVRGACTTSAAAWNRCVNRGDNVTILVNSNTSDS